MAHESPKISRGNRYIRFAHHIGGDVAQNIIRSCDGQTFPVTLLDDELPMVLMDTAVTPLISLVSVRATPTEQALTNGSSKILNRTNKRCSFFIVSLL
jgi:hypothetical protein